MIKNILAIVIAIVVAVVLGQIFFWLLSNIFSILSFVFQAVIILIIATPIFFYVRRKWLQ